MNDESSPDTTEPVIDDVRRPVVQSIRRQPRGTGAAALLLSTAAVVGAGYAAWRVTVIERGENNAQADLRHRLDGIDTRVIENERRSARNNELAATLRDQLAESERLRERMREDLLALADRSARAEALLADLSREQHGARDQLALSDARLMLAQADTRLRLFGDRQGARSALDLAAAALGEAGSGLVDLRNAVVDASAAFAADPRPSASTLLSELDAIERAVEPLGLRVVRDDAAAPAPAGQGWWSRQFAQLDHLITIREEHDTGNDVTPTKASLRNALTRARLAALEQNPTALSQALTAARASLAGCCDAQGAAPITAQLDRLIGIDWAAPQPDIAALRKRLDDRAASEAIINPTPASAPQGLPPGTMNFETPQHHAQEPEETT